MSTKWKPPETIRTEECPAGNRFAVGVHRGAVLFENRNAFAAEIQRRWNFHAALVEALEEAISNIEHPEACEEGWARCPCAMARRLRYLDATLRSAKGA